MYRLPRLSAIEGLTADINDREASSMSTPWLLISSRTIRRAE
jgi:hypothetical protein